MEFVRQILVKLKMSSIEGLLMKVFSHSLMWVKQTLQWSLCDHSSVHTNLMGLCASAVMWLTGGLHAMKSMLNMLHIVGMFGKPIKGSVAIPGILRYINSPKNGPYTLTGELWGAYHGDFGENRARYNGTAVYVELFPHSMEWPLY